MSGGPFDPSVSLARLLQARARLDVPTLQRALAESRAAGRPLGARLVEAGLLSAAEAEAAMAEVCRGREVDRHEPDPGVRAAEPPGSMALDRRPGEAAGSSPEGGERAAPRSGSDRWSRSATTDPWQPGLVVDGLRIVRRLGAGGMGVVYEAVVLESGASVAVKTLVAEADAGLVQRFAREGEAQARVDAHPNVVRIHACGEAGGRRYLVMDLASGGDLAQRLEAGPLPPLEAARIGAALARGLAHAHARGVLHRDLKPQNVLFDAPGGRPMLVDFGLASVQGAQALTVTGELLGTPAYMAPEQALGERVVDARADVFGLGAILFHALTGRPPTSGATTLEVLRRAIEVDAPRVRELRPDCPPDLERVVAMALAREPAERHASAGCLARDLEAIARGAAPDAANAREASGSRRRAGLALGVVVLVALIALAGARLAGLDPAPAPAPTPTPLPAPTPSPAPIIEPPPPITPTPEGPRWPTWALGSSDLTDNAALRTASSADQRASFEEAERQVQMRPGNALWRLAALHEEGLGCRVDVREAVRLLEQAAALDEPEAMERLGCKLILGEGVAPDAARGLALVEGAAARPDRDGERRELASYLAALMRFVGVGCTPDPAAFDVLTQLAAGGGHGLKLGRALLLRRSGRSPEAEVVLRKLAKDPASPASAVARHALGDDPSAARAGLAELGKTHADQTARLIYAVLLRALDERP